MCSGTGIAVSGQEVRQKLITLASLLAGAPILALPAFVNGVEDIIPILGNDTADEEHPDVVLHRNQFRIVDSGFLGELLTPDVHFHFYWGEP